MRCLVQRVSDAAVRVDDKKIGAIQKGIVVLFCAMEGDEARLCRKMATKVARLRIFGDCDGRMNLSVKDIGGMALVVSQFTLAADTSRGNRPGFSRAASPNISKSLYKRFIQELANSGIDVQSGQFGAKMRLSLTNDGPVTIWIDLQ